MIRKPVLAEQVVPSLCDPWDRPKPHAWITHRQPFTPRADSESQVNLNPRVFLDCRRKQNPLPGLEQRSVLITALRVSGISSSA